MTEKSSVTAGHLERRNGLVLNVDIRSLLWLFLFVFVLFTRFSHLGEKPFHHDESLYGKYIWNFYQGMGYQYDPMQHGPFMFHAELIPLFIAGNVTNYTIRILPATTGFFLILALYLTRKKFKKDVNLIAATIFAVNPVFMYFQRFLRHDAFFSLFSVLMFLYLVMWLQERKSGYAYALAGTLSILYCIKENAFINVLILFSFALLFLVFSIFSSKDKNKGSLNILGDTIHRYSLLAKVWFLVSIWGLSFVLYALANQFWKSSFPNWEKAVHTYWVIIFLVFSGVIAFLVYKGESCRREETKRSLLGLKPEFFMDSHIVAVGALIFAAIFVLLYTTFFTNKDGFWGGVYKWYIYWLGQHSQARIAGPFHYYNHQLLIYALIPFSVVVVGFFTRATRKQPLFTSIYIVAFAIFYAVLGKMVSPVPVITKERLFTNAHLAVAIGLLIAGTLMVISYLKERSFTKAFLLWWTLLAYLIYSYLQEKVPWLTMHIITPMILLSAEYIAETLKEKSYRRNIVLGFLGIFLLYTLHTSFSLCWFHEADPTEQMVYVQTTTDVTRILKEIDEIAFWTHQGKNMPMLITGNATWPFYWYLRDWKNVSYGQNVDPKRHLVVICDWEKRSRFKDKLGDNYTANKYELRAWYLPTMSDLAKGSMLRNAVRWILYRERFRPELYGAANICMFVREDVAKFSSSLEIKREKPLETKPRKTPDKPSVTERSLFQFGGFGTREGMFNLPKDIALDSKGNIYVVDNQNHRIQKFSPRGKFLKSWGSKGSDNGQFEQPTGIYVDANDNVFVADTWNHRIQKFDSNGKFLMSFGDSKMFWAPKDIFVDKDGFIYVVNTGYHRIQKFNKQGKEIWSIGTKGNGKNEFTEPVGIGMDLKRRLYITDSANHRIQIFDSGGRYIKSIPVFGWEYYYTEPYIAIDEENKQLFITDSQNNRIEVFDLNGRFKSFWGSKGSGNGQFNGPIGITVKNGEIYVVDSKNHRVQVFKDRNFN